MQPKVLEHRLDQCDSGSFLITVTLPATCLELKSTIKSHGLVEKERGRSNGASRTSINYKKRIVFTTKLQVRCRLLHSHRFRMRGPQV